MTVAVAVIVVVVLIAVEEEVIEKVGIKAEESEVGVVVRVFFNGKSSICSLSSCSCRSSCRSIHCCR